MTQILNTVVSLVGGSSDLIIPTKIKNIVHDTGENYFHRDDYQAGIIKLPFTNFDLLAGVTVKGQKPFGPNEKIEPNSIQIVYAEITLQHGPEDDLKEIVIPVGVVGENLWCEGGVVIGKLHSSFDFDPKSNLITSLPSSIVFNTKSKTLIDKHHIESSKISDWKEGDDILAVAKECKVIRVCVGIQAVIKTTLGEEHDVVEREDLEAGYSQVLTPKACKWTSGKVLSKEPSDHQRLFMLTGRPFSDPCFRLPLAIPNFLSICEDNGKPFNDTDQIFPDSVRVSHLLVNLLQDGKEITLYCTVEDDKVYLEDGTLIGVFNHTVDLNQQTHKLTIEGDGLVLLSKFRLSSGFYVNGGDIIVDSVGMYLTGVVIRGCSDGKGEDWETL